MTPLQHGTPAQGTDDAQTIFAETLRSVPVAARLCGHIRGQTWPGDVHVTRLGRPWGGHSPALLITHGRVTLLASPQRARPEVLLAATEQTDAWGEQVLAWLPVSTPGELRALHLADPLDVLIGTVWSPAPLGLDPMSLDALAAGTVPDRPSLPEQVTGKVVRRTIRLSARIKEARLHEAPGTAISTPLTVRALRAVIGGAVQATRNSPWGPAMRDLWHQSRLRELAWRASRQG